MDAIISGRAGRALLINGESLTSFDVNRPAILVPRKQADVQFLFGEARDLLVLENVQRDQAERILRFEFDCAAALDLSLIILDSELQEEIRKEAAHRLQLLLNYPAVLHRLEGILYGRPLPKGADLVGALRCCRSAESIDVERLLQRLGKRQPFIREVADAWRLLPQEMFMDSQQQDKFHRMAIQAGLFRDLAVALENKAAIEASALISRLSIPGRLTRQWLVIIEEWVGLLSNAGVCNADMYTDTAMVSVTTDTTLVNVTADYTETTGNLAVKRSSGYYVSSAIEFEDRTLLCVDCGQGFIWTAGEQVFFHDKGLKNEPKRCKPCKQARVRQRIEVTVNCAQCGQQTTVPFYPSQGRPVFCRSCFLAMRGPDSENT